MPLQDICVAFGHVFVHALELGDVPVDDGCNQPLGKSDNPIRQGRCRSSLLPSRGRESRRARRVPRARRRISRVSGCRRAPCFACALICRVARRPSYSIDRFWPAPKGPRSLRGASLWFCRPWRLAFFGMVQLDARCLRVRQVVRAACIVRVRRRVPHGRVGDLEPLGRAAKNG